MSSEFAAASLRMLQQMVILVLNETLERSTPREALGRSHSPRWGLGSILDSKHWKVGSVETSVAQ